MFRLTKLILICLLAGVSSPNGLYARSPPESRDEAAFSLFAKLIQATRLELDSDPESTCEPTGTPSKNVKPSKQKLRLVSGALDPSQRDAALAYADKPEEREAAAQTKGNAGGPERLPLPGAKPGQDDCLSLDDAVALAMRHHPVVRLARARVQAAQGTWLQSGLKPNPIFGYRGEEIGNEDSAGLQGFYIQQKIVRGNKLGLNRAVASHDVARANVEVAAAARRLVNNVRLNFYQALVAQRKRVLTRRLIQAASENVDVAERLLAADEAPRTNLLQAQAELETIRTQSITVDIFTQASLRKLAAAMGMPDMRIAAVQGDQLEAVPTLDWDDVVGRMLAVSPVLAAQRTKIERSKCAVARARAGQVPDVQLQTSVLYDDATNDTVASLSVGRSLLVHDWNQGAIRRACAELAAAGHELELFRLQATSELATLFQQYQAAAQASTRYRERVIPVASETLELIREGYAAGQIAYVELLTAQRTYFRTQLQWLDSLDLAWQAHWQIERKITSEAFEG